jgi:hypothetical protein
MYLTLYALLIVAFVKVLHHLARKAGAAVPIAGPVASPGTPHA